MTTRRRIKKRWILLTFFLVGCALSLIAMHPAVRAHVRGKIAGVIEAQLGLRADLGPLSFRLPLAFETRSLALSHPEHGLLLSVDRLEVRPEWGALWQGRLELAVVKLSGVAVRLRVRDGRIVNIGRAKPASRKKTASKPRRLPFDMLLVEQATLTIDAAPEYSATLEGVSARFVPGAAGSFSLTAQAPRGRAHWGPRGETLDQLRVALEVTPREVTVHELHARTSLGSLDLNRFHLALPADQRRANGHVRTMLDVGRIAALPPFKGKLPRVSGQLGFEGPASLTGTSFGLRGKVRGRAFTLEGFGFGTLDLEVVANEHELELLPSSVAYIDGQGGTVKLAGKLGLSGEMPIEVSSSVEGLEFEKLMAQLGVTNDCVVRWLMRGGFKLSGTIMPLAISGPIWADHLRFSALAGSHRDPNAREVIGTAPGRVTGRVALRPDALRFEALHGHLPHSDMLVDVHLGFGGDFSVIARGDHLDLQDASGLMGMALGGAGRFTLDVGGRYAKPFLTGTLDLEEFALHGFRIGHLRTGVNLEKAGLAARFTNTVVDKGESHYLAPDLLLDFSQAFSIEARAQLDRLALADFYHTFLLENDDDFTPYQGHVSGAASVRYTLGFPGDDPDGTLVVDTQLALLDVSVHGVSFRGGEADLTWRWEHIPEGTRGARLTVRELRLQKGEGAVHGSGSMGLNGTLDVTALAEELALSDLDFLKEASPRISGELNAVATFGGTLWVPLGQIDSELVGVAVGDRPLGDFRSYVRLTQRDDPWLKAAGDGHEVRCPNARRGLAAAKWDSDDAPDDVRRVPPLAYLVCGRGFDDKLSVDLALGVADDVPVRGSVLVRGMPAAWLFPREKREAALSGAFSASLEVRDGVLARPDSWVGHLRIDEARVGKDGAFVEAEGPVELRLTGKGAEIERARFVGNGSRLSAAGSVSASAGLRTRLTGAVDLAAVAGFVPGVTRLGGRLDLDINVTGELEQPALYGRATVHSGVLGLSSFAHSLSDVEASLAFSEREILLEKLVAQVSGGRLEAHGAATLAAGSIEQYELFLGVRDLSLEPQSGVDVGLSADARLVHKKGARLAELSGTVHLLRAVYKRPFSLGLTERLNAFSGARRVTRDNYDPSLDNLALDLRVVDDAPIRVANNMLTAELNIDDSERPFRIVGTDQRVGVLGLLNLSRGTLRFRNSEFVIDQGSVAFDDERRIHPRLDVSAHTELKRTADPTGARWRIALHATGETDNLKLETSSDPALAQEDIALLLTVGLTRAEAERLGAGSLTGGAALEALATVTGVDREIKRALPVIDDFAVTSAYSARTSRTEPMVVVGKRLSDSVRATATTGLTSESNFKTGVEWRLDQQTSVEAGYDNVQTTSSSQFGNVGLDLRWRLEFD